MVGVQAAQPDSGARLLFGALSVDGSAAWQSIRTGFDMCAMAQPGIGLRLEQSSLYALDGFAVPTATGTERRNAVEKTSMGSSFGLFADIVDGDDSSVGHSMYRPVSDCRRIKSPAHRTSRLASGVRVSVAWPMWIRVFLSDSSFKRKRLPSGKPAVNGDGGGTL